MPLSEHIGSPFLSLNGMQSWLVSSCPFPTGVLPARVTMCLQRSSFQQLHSSEQEQWAWPIQLSAVQMHHVALVPMSMTVYCLIKDSMADSALLFVWRTSQIDLTSPRTVWTVKLSVGGAICNITDVFSGIRWVQSLLTMWLRIWPPSYWIDTCLGSSLFLMSVSFSVPCPVSCHDLLELRQKLAHHPWGIILLVVLQESCSFLSEIALGALDMPKGSLLKQNNPNGVMNVVSSWESVASGIWHSWHPT